VNIPEAFDSVMPSKLVARLKELAAQSRHYRSKLEAIAAEIERIRVQIQDMTPGGTPPVSPSERDRTANSRS
jgi:hypothetical protein